MIKELNESASFCLFKDIHSTDVEDSIMDLPWERLRPMLTKHQIKLSKDGMNFWPVKLKPRNEWVLSEKKPGDKSPQTYRTKDNVESISFVVMDLDEPGCKEKVEAYFHGMEYILYSTHSYNKNQPHKFRLVMPLESPIPRDEWGRNFNILCALVDGDTNCKNLSRIYYLPSHSPEAEIEPVVIENRGRILNTGYIEELGKKAARENTKVKEQIDRTNAPKQRRHFTGEVIEYDGSSASGDYTYKGMLEAHAKLVEELRQSDSRHHFAQRVIFKDIMNNAENTNISALIKFIFRASQEYSSRPLYQGNTISEIPELITSSISKSERAQQISQRFKTHTDFVTFVEKCLNQSLGEAMKAYGHDVNSPSYEEKWSFPKYAPRQTNEERHNPFSKRSFETRHEAAYKQLESGNNVERAIQDILYKEMARKAVYYTKTLDYLESALKDHQVPGPVNTLKNAILKMDLDEDVDRRLKGALKIKIAENKQVMARNPPPTSSPSP